MSGLGRVNGGHERLAIAHFAHQHDVGIFAHRMLHSDAKIFYIVANFALIDQAFIFGEREFNGVFQRENVFAVILVDVIQHRRNGRAFSAPGHAGQ